MYISTFHTFTSNKTPAKAEDREPFKIKKNVSTNDKVENPPTETVKPKTLPVDYVAKNSSFATKLALQNSGDELLQSTQEYSNIKKTKNAEKAYGESSTLSFLFSKAETTLNQTPRYSPKSTEQVNYSKMVNTYAENDRYYQITA